MVADIIFVTLRSLQKRVILLGVVSFMLCLSELKAQLETSGGARSAALAGAALASEDAWAGIHNQAALTFLGGFSAGVFAENRFAMKELGNKGFSVAMSFRNNAFGINFSSFGYSAFSSSRAGIAYSIKLSERFSLGTQLNFHSISIGDIYGKSHTVSGEGGFIYKVSNDLTLAGHLYNPTRSRLSDFEDERIPSIMRVGMRYAFSGNVYLLTEVHKSTDTKPLMVVGIEYQIIDLIVLRGGFSSSPARYGFGVGCRLSHFQAEIAASYHLLLGITPQVSLVYSIQKQE